MSPRTCPGTSARAALAGGLLVLPVLLAGCGSDDAEPSPSPSATSTSTEETPSEASSSASGDPAASDAATPASGPALELGKLSLHVPETWRIGSTLGTLEVSADGPQGKQFLSIVHVPSPSADEPVLSQAKAVVRDFGWTGKATIEPIAAVGGEPAFHVSGELAAHRSEDQIGLVHDGVAYTFHFDRYAHTIDDDEWADLIASVLASATWK